MDRDHIFEHVSAIISEFQGVSKEKITWETSLLDDLGIAGLDGHDLVAVIEEKFPIDWTGFEPIAVFGPEAALGTVPHPDDMLWEPQACNVEDLVNSILANKWQGELPVMRSPEKQRVYRIKYRVFNFFLAALLVSLVYLVS